MGDDADDDDDDDDDDEEESCPPMSLVTAHRRSEDTTSAISSCAKVFLCNSTKLRKSPLCVSTGSAGVVVVGVKLVGDGVGSTSRRVWSISWVGSTTPGVGSTSGVGLTLRDEPSVGVGLTSRVASSMSSGVWVVSRSRESES